MHVLSLTLSSQQAPKFLLLNLLVTSLLSLTKVNGSESLYPPRISKPFIRSNDNIIHSRNNNIQHSRNNNIQPIPVLPSEGKPLWYSSSSPNANKTFVKNANNDGDSDCEHGSVTIEEEEEEVEENVCDDSQSSTSRSTTTTILNEESIEITMCKSMKEDDDNESMSKNDDYDEMMMNVVSPFNNNNQRHHQLEPQQQRQPQPISKRNVTNKGFINLVSIYEHFLMEHELLTKSITSGVIGVLGDFLAQCFEHKSHHHHQSTKLHSQQQAFVMDKVRLFGLFVESLFIASPIMHYAYDYMEYLSPINSKSNNLKQNHNAITNFISKWRATFIHVLADFFILGPISVLSLMVCTSIVEGRTNTLIQELSLDLIPTVWASTVASLAFVPMQLLAFKHLPLKYRILYMNVQDIFWNAIVSVMAHRSRT